MKKAVLLFTLLLMVSFVGIARADPSATLRIVPEGAVHTGMAIMTTSPAKLELYMINSPHSPITKVWLIFVTNLDTYNSLTGGSITTNFTGSWTLSQSDFNLVVDAIPPISNYTENPSLLPGYPGCYKDEQYQPGRLRGQLGLGDADPVYYAYRNITAFLSDNELVYGEVKKFTLYVNAPGASDLKVLVLAMGYSSFADKAGEGRLDERSPYSESTLVVLEITPLILTMIPFAALGLYAKKRKKRSA